MKQDIENIIKKNLPETRYELGGYPEEGYYIEVSEDGEYIKSDEINTSLIADEVLKVVGEKIESYKKIELLKLRSCENDKINWNYHQGKVHQLEDLLSNLSPNKENEKRDFIYCLDKNCDGYKGGLWVDKLKQDDTHNAFICPDCCKLIPVVNINVERNLLIKENKNNE